MALSEQEQRLLDEMERSLYQNEADVMSTTPKDGPVVSARAIIVIVLSLVAGLAIVVTGMAVAQPWGPWVGIFGFVLMIAGIVWALYGSKGNGGSDATASSSANPSSGTNKSAQKSGGSFMNRMEDRWERRQDGDM